ncbi:glycosyltransferase family 25 protein [Arthrobacter sp. SX1312]|uniref:glycosyltransferase family 25 protein n=1 Tax=Arthrobacter sp. SX1312 TaxID=2058896 RepID=UPI000CE3D8AE|nr:glycosyltransferase family 25 protein [Arthrobacter sp. SX1312]
MTTNSANVKFNDDLERKFDAVNIDEAKANRTEFLLYIEAVHQHRGPDTALDVLDRYRRKGLLPALAAIALRQFASRTDDFGLASEYLNQLHSKAPQDGYVASIYLEALLADAQVDLVKAELPTFLSKHGLGQSEQALQRLARIAAVAGAWEACDQLLELESLTPPDNPFFWQVMARRVEHAAKFSGQSIEVPALVVNLKRDRRKLTLSSTLFPTLGIYPERVEATNGNDLSPADVRQAVAGPGVTLGAGAIGCALSHISAWETIAEAGHDFALILEDDALPFSLQDISQSISCIDKFDVLFVNERMSALTTGHHGGSHSSLWDRLQSRPESMKGWGTDGYIVSRNGATKLAEAIASDKIVGHIDGQLGSYGIQPHDEPVSRAQHVGKACRTHLRSGLLLDVKCLDFPVVTAADFGYSSIKNSGGHR